jgi:hypothetical protein
MDKRPEPLIRADELEDIGAESRLTRAMAAQTIRLLYSEKEWYRTKWVGLTDEERYLCDSREFEDDRKKYALAIEAKLREKNAND